MVFTSKKPLPDRHNIIITTNEKLHQTKNNASSNIYYEYSFENALKYCYGLQAQGKINEIFVIGGKKLLEEAIHHPDLHKLYHTMIDTDAKCDLHVKELSYNYLETKLEDKSYSLINSEILFDKDKLIKKEFQKDSKLIFNEYVNVDRGENCYLELLNKIINEGEYRKTRNAYTKSLFGETIKFNMRNDVFPLITTRKGFLRGIFEELSFFFKGETDSKILEEKGVNIWKGNTTRDFLDSRGLYEYREGLMGPMYGFQWRHFNSTYNPRDVKEYGADGFDQIEYILNEIISNPKSRRLLMTTFNPDPKVTKNSVLYPCHGIKSQFYIEETKIEGKIKRYVSLVYDIRSSDVFLGLFFNIASSALMLKLFCATLTLRVKDGSVYEADKLIINIGDAHIYEQHFDQVKKQLERIPRAFPKLYIKENKELIDYKYEDLELEGYKPHPGIKAPMIP